MKMVAVAIAAVLGLQQGPSSGDGPRALPVEGELLPGERAEYFGLDVDIEGDLAVVGAYYDVFDGLDAGSVYVFRRIGDEWSLEATLRAPSPADEDWFGWGVSLSGDTIAVSAMKDDNTSGADRGTVFVFRYGGAGWMLEAALESPGSGIYFGCGVDVAGDRLVAGHYAGPDRSGEPHVYVFERSAGSWSHSATISDTSPGFGRQVSVSGDRIAVAAMMGGLGLPPRRGEVIVYGLSGAVWLNEARLTASDPSADDWFGYDIDLDAEDLIVSAPGSWALATHVDRAFIFRRTGAAWVQTGRHVLAPLSPSGDAPTVGIDFPRAIAGGHTFLHDGGAWAAGETVTGSFRDVSGVGVSGDTFVVGTSDGGSGARAFALRVGEGSAPGAGCLGPFECASGFCVDGVCCDQACNESWCEACVAARTGGPDGICAPLAASLASAVVCRGAVDVCDAVETCTSTSRTCPPDAIEPAGTICQPLFGPCDVAERCDGMSVRCPTDERLPAGTICRPSVGPCDAEERCDGSAFCGADRLAAAGTLCRPPAGACDMPERCTGTTTICPSDRLLVGDVCRAAADFCDAPEICSGDVTCPPDGVTAAGTPCRVAIGVCDIEEVCDGTSIACPVDEGLPDGTRCGGPACDGRELCVSGWCISQEVPSCDDHDPCTTDSCNEPDAACTHAPMPNCCTSTADCDDGRECTADRCDGARCVFEERGSCADVPMRDGGLPPVDAPTGLDAGELDAGAHSPPPSSGCSCRVVQQHRASHASWLLGVALAARAAWQRRRARR